MKARTFPSVVALGGARRLQFGNAAGAAAGDEAIMKRRESNRAPREFLILWHDGREHRTTRLTVPHDASDETADDTIRNFANSFAADLHWMVDVTGRRVRQYDEPWRHLDDDGVEEYLG